MRSKNDLKRGVTAEDAALGEEDEDDDDDAFDGLLAEGEAMEAYKFGETSGSKLVDRMRKKEEKEKRIASNAALNELAGSGASLNKLAGSSNSLSKMAVRESNNSLEAMAAGIGAPAYGWPAPAPSPWGASGSNNSFGGLSAFGAPSAAEQAPLSPTAPSMPLPSTPSFQAQSRRGNNRLAEGAAAAALEVCIDAPRRAEL